MEAFARQMRQKQGTAFDRLASALGPDGASTPEFYEVKNHSLRFSLDVTFQFDGNFYAEYLSGVVIEHRKYQARPRRVLDLGCDNGLLTCFYAQHFPEAEVVGLDNSESGVKNARQLADKLGLKNVSFHVADVRRLDQVDAVRGEFDLITSIFLLMDANGFPGVPGAGPLEWAALPPPDMWSGTLSKVARFLSPDGILFSSERVDNRRAMAWWVAALAAAGLPVQWKRSAPQAHDSIRGSQNGKLKPYWFMVFTSKRGPVAPPTVVEDAEGIVGKWV
jgi:SAM-dependent methyltransferase